MTQDRRFERDLGGLLTDLSMPAVPAYRDDIVRLVADTRQRPAWTFPERWLPMDVTTQRIAATPIRWRPIAILVLVALLLGVVVAIGVGSRPRLPAPFGPARNGLIAYHEAGDIYLGDPATGTSRAIASGLERDEWPLFSRDGTRLVFLRAAPGADASHFMLMNADGTGSRTLTTEPLESVASADWSGDGRFVVVEHAIDGHPAMGIIDVERGGIRPLEVGLAGHGPVFRPPDGREVAFTVGEDSDAAVYVVDRNGGQPRQIAWGEGPAYSPDGSRIAYGRSYQPQEERNETRVMNADGSDERLVGDRPDIQYQGTPVWSPDGTNLLLFRHSRSAGNALAMVPADGSGPGREFAIGFSGGFGWLAWSPDGNQIASMPGDELVEATVVNLADGASRRVPRWYTASWQRLAP